MNAMPALVAITRPLNSISAGAAAVLGAVIGADFGAVTTITTWLAAIAACFIVAGTNVLNDAHDADTDSINRPARAIPSGAVSRTQANRFGVLLLAGGIAAAVPLGRGPALVALALALISQIYTYYLKATILWGNVFVATMAAAPILFGAWIAGGMGGIPLAASALAASYLFAYEVLTSIDDASGDRAAAIRTLATEHPQRARRLHALLAWVFLALALGTGLATGPNVPFVVAVCLLAIAPLFASVIILRKHPNDTRRALEVAKGGWYLGLMSLLFLA